MAAEQAQLILRALDEGRVSFADLLPRCRDSGAEVWAQTLDFLALQARESPACEVALAMCQHFVPEACPPQAVVVGQQVSASLLSVSERHVQEVVGGCYLNGWCLSRGQGGATLDQVRAVTCFQQASSQGYPLAQYELALCYRHGRGGLAVDLGEAARLFREAAERGHVGAQLCMARCCALGEGGVAADPQASSAWLRRATKDTKEEGRGGEQLVDRKEQGDGANDGGDAKQEAKQESRSYLRAATCFLQGKGVEQDVQEAHRLYGLW